MEKIAVIGIGKLGLCFALLLERAGYEVLGIDARAEYVDSLNRKTFNSPEPGVVEALRGGARFRATHRLDALREFPARLIFVAVATPTDPVGGYDHRAIDELFEALYALRLPAQRRDIALMCTTLPGYCDSLAEKAMEHNYYLSYKPEFIAQGSILRDLQHPDQMLIGAADDDAADKIISVYARVHRSKPAVFRMSLLSAEIAKLATNCFLTMKISFANAIGDLCAQVGADPDRVLSLIGSDGRIGNKFLRYGFGYGGPCFPRDNRALSHYASRQGVPLLLSKATDLANQQHLEFQVARYLSEYGPEDAIHFTSVSYKDGTVILEESQRLALALRLAGAGRRVIIQDCEEVISQLKIQYGNLFEYEGSAVSGGFEPDQPSAPR
jgi:UDPglucose 6-dehydrogenase